MTIAPKHCLHAIAVATLFVTICTNMGRCEDPRPEIDASEERTWIATFRDGISHWQKQNDNFEAEQYDPTQVKEIADNILLYQRDNGGWKANEDMTRILTDAEKKELIAGKSKTDTSFDNRNTYTQTRYLGHVFELTGRAEFRKACERGLAFILQAQYPNGGWPHTYPNQSGYYPRITIADDVLVGILRTVREAAEGQSHFAFLDNDTRLACQDALERGDALLLDLQVKSNGALTGWAGQYDEKSLVPCQGRTFEPPALVGQESATVLRYLMSQSEPNERVKQAVIAGAKWFKRSELTGFKIVRIDAPTARYDHHTSRFDLEMVKDPNAPPLWARFYDIATNEPFLANRDGKRVSEISQLTRERRTGATWFGPYGSELLAKDYPAWLKRWKITPP